MDNKKRVEIVLQEKYQQLMEERSRYIESAFDRMSKKKEFREFVAAIMEEYQKTLPNSFSTQQGHWASTTFFPDRIGFVK